jgi:hypothetical protein
MTWDVSLGPFGSQEECEDLPFTPRILDYPLGKERLERPRIWTVTKVEPGQPQPDTHDWHREKNSRLERLRVLPPQGSAAFAS